MYGPFPSTDRPSRYTRLPKIADSTIKSTLHTLSTSPRGPNFSSFHYMPFKRYCTFYYCPLSTMPKVKKKEQKKKGTQNYQNKSNILNFTFFDNLGRVSPQEYAFCEVNPVTVYFPRRCLSQLTIPYDPMLMDIHQKWQQLCQRPSLRVCMGSESVVYFQRKKMKKKE